MASPVPAIDGTDDAGRDGSKVSREGISRIESGTLEELSTLGLEAGTGGDDEVSAGVLLLRFSLYARRVSEFPTS